ncbi:hypothetical protein QFZ20_005376 [Flavobacterium sp. W4I14]|nr:hypothetical protein [Flavobacterium sp. W4I14]
MDPDVKSGVMESGTRPNLSTAATAFQINKNILILNRLLT